MIHIDRHRLDEQGNPIEPNSGWFENARATTEIAKREMAAHEADRSVYGNEEVRRALEALFYGKCAYCESGLLNAEWDVEHFRPKGRVAERSDHPGYYWLAYEWVNLFPACKFCNQRRRDKPKWGDLTQAGIGGKSDQFPLTDETTRVMSHLEGDIANETTLLLNPCIDNPEQCLRFDVKGQIYGVDLGERGETTIEVCFLKRLGLKREREKVIQEITKLLLLANQWERNGNSTGANELRTFLKQRAASNERPYLAVERYVLKYPEEFGV